MITLEKAEYLPSFHLEIYCVPLTGFLFPLTCAYKDSSKKLLQAVQFSIDWGQLDMLAGFLPCKDFSFCLTTKAVAYFRSLIHMRFPLGYMK